MTEEKSRTTFALFCEISSCMGVIDWYYSKNLISKTFWALILTAGIVITIWQTQGVINQFITRTPYRTSISKEVLEDGIPYPNITVCNFNRARQSLINITNVNPKVLSYAFQLVAAPYACPLELVNDLNLTEYEEEWRKHYVKHNYTSAKDFYRQFGHTFHDTVLLITISGIPILLDYEEVWTNYGRCFNIMPTNITQAVPGSVNALKLFLNPKMEEYMTDTIINNYIQDGLIVVPNYNFETMTPSPLFVYPGAFASVSLTASRTTTVIEDTPLLPRDCQPNAALKVLNETYTPANCMYDCYLTFVFKKCGCVTLANTKSEYPLCNITVVISCASLFATSNITGVKLYQLIQLSSGAHWAKKFKYIPSTDKGLKTCFIKCRNPCYDFMSVAATMTTTNSVSSNFRKPLLHYIKNIVNNNDERYDEDFSRNVITVEIYFSSLEINVISTDENIPLFTFIGNVGGQLGLWVGVSMLTLVQCVYYFVLACLKGELRPYRRKRLPFVAAP